MSAVEARQLRAEMARDLQERGKNLRDIAEELGVSVGTVHRDLNPKAAKRYRIASREHRRQKATERR